MTDEAWRAQHVIFEQAAFRVLRCPVPVIAAVEGFALAGGCELAILSDFIVAGESAVFGVPHPDLGEGVTAAVVSPRQLTPTRNPSGSPGDEGFSRARTNAS